MIYLSRDYNEIRLNITIYEQLQSDATVIDYITYNGKHQQIYL